MAELNYNAADHEPAQDGYDAIPVGDYEAAIVASEIKTTKAGTGKYLDLTVEILGPTHAGRKVFPKINVENPNKQAVDIGMRELRSICDAIGIAGFRQTEELHDKPLVVRIKHEQYQGEPQARVASWKSNGGQVPPAVSKPPPSTPSKPSEAAPPATGGGTTNKPWES